MTNKTQKEFLEKQGFIMACCLFLEQKIKELIIIKKNPEIVDNNGKIIRGKKYTEERREYGKESFNQNLCKDFAETFDGTLTISLVNLQKEVEQIRNLRDFFFHSISDREKIIQMNPRKYKRYEEIMQSFGKELSYSEEYFNQNPRISVNILEQYKNIIKSLTEFEIKIINPIIKSLGLS